jgi:hypothetical protein
MCLPRKAQNPGQNRTPLSPHFLLSRSHRLFSSLASSILIVDIEVMAYRMVGAFTFIAGVALDAPAP